MEVWVQWRGQQWRVQRAQPLSIAIPLRADGAVPNAFFLRQPEFQPVRIGSFVGSVAQGGSCNCQDVTFNPHGNGTHTECLGHITAEPLTIAEALTCFLFIAQLISVQPRQLPNGDQVIAVDDLPPLEEGIEAVVVRTLPNGDEKLTRQYSGTNPPYVLPETAAFFRDFGIQHFLIDLPSMDREDDGGKLLAHRAFWHYPEQPRRNATITEMVYVPNAIADGIYMLELQVPAFALDAAPSRPVLYPMESI